jgi:hypothetical protein
VRADAGGGAVAAARGPGPVRRRLRGGDGADQLLDPDGEQTATAYASQLEDLAAALILWRRHEHRSGTGPRSRNLLAASCGCGRRIRVAKTTLAEAPILCGACAQPFAPADPNDQDL